MLTIVPKGQGIDKMSLPESDMAASLCTCIVCVSCKFLHEVEMLSYAIWTAFIAHTNSYNCLPRGQVDIEEEPWCFSCIGFVTFAS